MLGLISTIMSPSDLAAKGRSLHHTITNKSKLPLVLAADLHESGRWWTVPPALIPPNQSATYSSCNRDGGLLTGTTGAVCFRIAQTDLYAALFFSNPYVGAYKAGAKVYRGLPSTPQLKADYASNDVVLVKQGTTVFGNIHIHFAPAVDRDSPVSFTVDIQGDSLSGVPLDSLVPPPTDLAAPPQRNHPLAVPRSIDPPYTLRLLSYNLFLRPLLIADSTTFASNDYKESRTDLFIQRAFEHYDVLCLHEVFDASLRATLKQAAKRWDINYCLEGPSSGGAAAPISSGLLVLSRFPILEPHTEMFAHAVGADAFSAKGFVSCKLLLPQGGTLNLVSTHLQANPSGHPHDQPVALTAEPATVRYSQLIELASALRQRPHLTDAGLVLVGDLNIPGGSPEYDRMVHLMRAVLGPGAQWIDLFDDAGMAKPTWKPWASIAHPTNLVDVTMASIATGASPSEVARHENLSGPQAQGARLDYAVFIKTGNPASDSEVPLFHLQIEPFVVEGERKESEMFEKLSDHDALCIYMA